eukprot:1270258-Pleurochrysis_carterae.AAC.1
MKTFDVSESTLRRNVAQVVHNHDTRERVLRETEPWRRQFYSASGSVDGALRARHRLHSASSGKDRVLLAGTSAALYKQWR